MINILSNKSNSIYQIIQAAVKHCGNSSTNQIYDNSNLVKEVEKWREEAEANINCRKRLESTILAIKNENKTLIEKVKDLSGTTNNLEISREMFQMLKSMIDKVEDDNKHLKE